MADPQWYDKNNSAQSFGRAARIITPGASDIDPICKSVVMLATGDITVVPTENANGTTLSFVGLPAGYVVPFQVRRVTACSSTCATID